MGLDAEIARYPARFGEAAISRDPHRRNAWQLAVDGVPQSHVDLDDPTYLAFGYIRHIADVLDSIDPPCAPLTVTHVGGGAGTLARYVAATRPRSRQIVFEPDEGVVVAARRHLGLGAVRGLRVRVLDGLAGLGQGQVRSADVIIIDAFERSILPVVLVTRPSLQRCAEVLRPAGIYVLNVADGYGLGFARRVVATVCAVFSEVAMLAEPGVLRGRRFGNVIVVGSAKPLPVAALRRRTAGSAFPARCVTGSELRRFRGQARPLIEGDATVPEPPPDLFGLPATQKSKHPSGYAAETR
jgi:hypothetical protein